MQFRIYLVAKGKDTKAGKLKVNHCYYVLGEKLSKSTVNLCVPMKKTKNAIKMFVANSRNCARVLEISYMSDCCSISGTRRKVRGLIDNFFSELKILSLTCEFGHLRESLIRDRIIGGVLSREWRGKLRNKPDLAPQTAHDYCGTFELAEQQKHRFNKPTVAGSERSLHPLKNIKVQERTPARNFKFCGYKHPFTQPTH